MIEAHFSCLVYVSIIVPVFRAARCMRRSVSQQQLARRRPMVGTLAVSALTMSPGARSVDARPVEACPVDAIRSTRARSPTRLAARLPLSLPCP